MLGQLKALYINLHDFISIELIFILSIYKYNVKKQHNIKI